jgi:hypothetical protein
MAYGGPLLCAWIRFILRHAKKERVRKGHGRSEATGKRPWRLSSGNSGCAGKAWDIASCRVWQVPSGATTFPLPFSFASLCSIPCISWLSRAPFYPYPLFLLPSIPQWHSPILRAGSNRLLFVSRWQPSIPIVLCSLTLPLTKPPLTTPTHRLAGLRNG